MKLKNLTETVDAKKDSAIETLIDLTLFNSVQFHIYHWQTKSYAEHKALGDFYEELGDKVDELAELYMQDNKVVSPKLNFEVQKYSKETALRNLDDFKAHLVETETRLMSDKTSAYHAAADIMVDLQNACDKLRYLLTLK